MFHLLRSAPFVLPWLTVAALVWGTQAFAGQPSSKESPEIKASSGGSASLISACRNEAETQAAPPKRLHSVRWDKTAQPEVVRTRDGPHVVTRVSLTGWARSDDAWVPIAAQCGFEKGRPAFVSLDLAPPSRAAGGLDLSGITTLPKVPVRPEAALPSLSEPPPPTDPPEASGSSTIGPIFRETPSLPPYLNKEQDFLHDHRFGIELRAPF